MIKLTKLELHNFLSHVDTVINLDNYEGLVLIEGITSDGHYSSNGAGKSTILEGIVYALTGDTLRGVSVNDVINRNYKKNTRVALSFVKDGVPYTVTRYRKDDNYGDALSLTEDEKDISKRLNKDTQSLLENVLGISYKILVSTVLLGEGLSSRFTQLSDPEKKSLIESTLNLNYDINKIRDKANAKLKDCKLQEATIDGQLSVLEEKSNTDVESLEKVIQDQEACIKIYEETSSHINAEYERLLSEIDAVSPKLKIIQDAINKHATLSRDLVICDQNIQHYKGEKERVLSDQVPVCALCRQALQSAESKQAVIQNYDVQIKDFESKSAEISAELSQLPDQDTMRLKSEELSKEYAEKSQKSRDLMQDYNSYQVKLAESRKDIERCREAISSAEDCSSQIKEKKSLKSQVSKDAIKYDYFYKLFSPTGIIVNILSDAIDYINTRLSTYSEVLLEKDYNINFVKGKISLVDSKGSSYQSLSNGEKRRLDISIQFALHDYVHTYCGMQIDCCYIDEILDTLDEVGVDNIFDVLRLKLDYCNLKSIYVITHNNSLKSKFDQVITIKKDEKGDSSVV